MTPAEIAGQARNDGLVVGANHPVAYEHNPYNHYEISNIALPGYECKHNLKYWNCEEYIGFGAGAHSFYENKRFYNDKNYNRQYDADPSPSEFIFLGLRKMAGISKQEYEQRYGKKISQDMIDKNVSLGTLEENGDIIRLTKRGIEISNQVFIDFM